MVEQLVLSSQLYKIFRSGLSILLSAPLCPVPNSTYGAYSVFVNTCALAPSCIVSDLVLIELRRCPVFTGANNLAFFCIFFAPLSSPFLALSFTLPPNPDKLANSNKKTEKLVDFEEKDQINTPVKKIYAEVIDIEDLDREEI